MGIKNIRVHIALFTVSFLYAILFSWAGEIMPKFISPEAFVWLRIVVACLLFNVTAVFYRWEKVNFLEDWKLWLICAFFGTAGNMFLFFKGLSMTKPINGAVLMMVTPMFVAIFDHIKNKRTPSLETVIGLTIGSGGSILLIAGRGAQFTSETLMGDVWIAINAAFYAIYLVYVKKLVHKYNPITVNRITFTLGVVIIAPLGAVSLFHTDFSAIPTDIYLKIGYTLFFTSFLVYMLNAYGVKHGSPGLVGIYIYLQPILATAMALLLQRDEITVYKVFLTFVILFGVWLVVNNDKRGFSLKERFKGK
jgi:drug/metabolite transporter (DMT)-like permease